MTNSNQQLWERFQQYYIQFPQIDLDLDLSRMNFPDNFFPSMEDAMQKSFAAMAELEAGAIANPDERRMVGHYWLRNPALAPNAEIRQEIKQTISDIKAFAADVHAGRVCGKDGPFKNLLLIGIGGSALGPQFVSNALSQPGQDKMAIFFSENTDPDGMDRVFAQLGSALSQTLVIVISKSGGTKETRNGMVEAEIAYKKQGLKLGDHTVAITSKNSDLDKVAVEQNWIRRFPMWDWVGGRTSELSAVGLLPAALQGFDIDNLLAGAKTCDELTRLPKTMKNPAALLALMWYYAGNGKGSKNLIVLPYKDRLELFSKYLQQLIMESLGKALDLDGKQVNQGISVFGNKGSTDQHSYIQQLREGLPNFFVTFIEVLKDRNGKSMEVDPGVTTGDYLAGFYQGTRRALYENGRESVTITIKEVTPFAVGTLIALFERVVGLYSRIININAYHQPGVEAGKKAAGSVIQIQGKVLTFLSQNSGRAFTADAIATGIGSPAEAETVFKICQHLAANPDRGIKLVGGTNPGTMTFGKG